MAARSSPKWERSLRGATCFSPSNLCESRSGPRILVVPPHQVEVDWGREAGTAGGSHISWAAPGLPSHGDNPAGFEPHCHSEAPFRGQLGSLLLNHKSTYIYFHFFFFFKTPPSTVLTLVSPTLWPTASRDGTGRGLVLGVGGCPGGREGALLCSARTSNEGTG